MTLILASSSPIRRAMLDAAGVGYRAVAADVDEAAVKAVLHDQRQIAAQLAAAKALAVSNASAPGDWVIGSDSVVTVEGRLFNKPADCEEAAEHLRFFSGRLMELTSAVALARGGVLDWSHAEMARLRVRILTDDFIATYLDAEWPEVGYTVGVFRMEGRGVQLFSSIGGDYFAILGMPLVPLLAALRERGLIAA
jgi:septum formation protein